MAKWRFKNAIELENQVGLKDGPQFQFLSGILFSPSTSTSTVPLLQRVIQADAAHMSIGKYTLFSAYSASANSNMSPLSFAIMFGNEDKENWMRFWKFTVDLHPSINSPDVTIVSDQDKGSIAAVKEMVPQAFHFHCAWHRRQNIISTCGGKSSTVVNSALWTFNLLEKCKTLPSINSVSAEPYNNMHPTDLHYLTKIPNEAQYPAARCTMGDNVYMYSLSASSGIESMNRANMEARKATAVDMLNATMLLIRMESKRFEQFKHQTHKTLTPLTPRGVDLMQEAFKGVESIDYSYVLANMEAYYQCNISKIVENAFVYKVTIPKTPTHGSHFGTCTCGVPKRDGIPCEHMVMMAKAGVIQEEWFTRLSIMPYWLTAAHWRQQFPQSIVCCEILMSKS